MTKMLALSWKLLLGALLTVTGMLPAAHGQTILNLRIGDESSRLIMLSRPPYATDTYKSYTLQKWLRPSGDEFSATVSQDGKIVYMESDWGGKSNSPACDLPGILFGVTTLSDLRKRFGSNGFAFADRGGVIQISGGVVLLNSYEIEGNVVTFYTKISADISPQKERKGAETIPDDAKLDAVSVAQADYAAGEWGKRIYDPGYKKAEWK